MSINIFSNQTLQVLTDCLFWFIQTRMIIQKGKKLRDITYQKVLIRIIMSSSVERTFMTNLLILM